MKRQTSLRIKINLNQNQHTVSCTIFIVSWKVLIDSDKLSKISSWSSNLVAISFSSYSLKIKNSLKASLWNVSMYLCCWLSFPKVSSLNLPSERDLSVRSASIFLCRSYLASSTAYMMSFSRWILVSTSVSKPF